MLRMEGVPPTIVVHDAMFEVAMFIQVRQGWLTGKQGTHKAS